MTSGNKQASFFGELGSFMKPYGVLINISTWIILWTISERLLLTSLCAYLDHRLRLSSKAVAIC